MFYVYTLEPTSDTSLTETYSAMVEQETLASLSQETQQQPIPEQDEEAQTQFKHEQEEEEILPDQNDSIIAQDAVEQLDHLDTSFEERKEEEDDSSTKQRRKRKGIPIKVRELHCTSLITNKMMQRNLLQRLNYIGAKVKILFDLCRYPIQTCNRKVTYTVQRDGAFLFSCQYNCNRNTV